MARYRCPECRRRIAGERRCHRCGWRKSGEGDAPVAARRPWGAVLAAIMLAVAILGLGTYRVSGAAIADWYADFALRNLPAGFSSFAPADTPTGAFNHCVSRVVKKVSDGSAVETFPAYSEQNTTRLSEGRYSVQAVLEGVTLQGEKVRRPFSCIVRYEGGRWTTERLAVGEMADLLPTALLR